MHTAVDRSNINALRLSLLQATGDPELAAMTVRKQKIRGGMQFSFTISDIDTEVVKEKAIAYLNKGPHTVPQPPPRERSAELLELFSGEPLNDAELDFAIEELAFDNFPRQVKWTARPDTKTIDSYNVVIIGAGDFRYCCCHPTQAAGYSLHSC
jgi:4-hydroxyacetophenone monooxygenase